MVAGTLSNEKESLPTVVIPEPTTSKMSEGSSKKHVILTSWASVVTALLLFVIVGGAFYMADLKSRDCSTYITQTTSTDTTSYTQQLKDDEGNSVQEDIHLNDIDETELIVKKTPDGNIETIAAIDYKKQIMATYVSKYDSCYLLAGTDMQYHNSWNGVQNQSVALSSIPNQKHFTVTGNKVTDSSLIPAALRLFCNGKPTYWIQPDDGTTMSPTHNRKKRQTVYEWLDCVDPLGNPICCFGFFLVVDNTLYFIWWECLQAYCDANVYCTPP